MANLQDPSHRPDYRPPLYDEMSDFWTTVRDVRGGTSRMRQAGRKYLPKHPLESNTAYNNRKNRSFLYNFYELTLSGVLGRIFRRDPVLGADVPVEIRGEDGRGFEQVVLRE